MTSLVLIRHGESVWHLEGRFTGWTDVAFSSVTKLEIPTGIPLIYTLDAGLHPVSKDSDYDLAISRLINEGDPNTQ